MTAEFAFVLGTGRCGSTLVHEVLARHPDIGFLSNVEDRFPLPVQAGRWNNDLYRQVPDRFTRKGRLRFAPSEGYRALERSISTELSTPCRDLLAEDVTPWLDRRTRSFFESRATVQGKPMFLHKFTGWPRSGFLDRIFPRAKFVHVVRDGRAVANSFVQMPWWRGFEGPDSWGWGPLSEADRKAWEDSDRSFAVLAGLQWKLLIEAFELARRQIPEDRWLEIRYEDFVASPKTTLESALEFLDLSWNDTFDAGFERYRFDAGRKEAFRDDLGIQDVARLEQLLEAPLGRYDYIESMSRTAEASPPRRKRG
ncbi:MAG TPA: sulfotransferase [Actinomycetota bacterium]